MKILLEGKYICYSDIVRFLHILYMWIFQDEFNQTIKKRKLKRIVSKILNYHQEENIWRMLENVKINLKEDLAFFMEADPAVTSKEEVILTYPGLHAIFAYRIANILDQLGVMMIPRIITELAHSKTGIDIHPKAKIGCPFFIDHGAGIVIGATSIIGDFVKMYHGVTLGALNLENISCLQDVKRHPTIGNGVVLYANATILGGNTMIGDDSTIGCCMIITHSVAENTLLYIKNNQIIQKKKSL